MYIRLKELRKTNNFTQKEISNYLEISTTQYYLYESGKRNIPLHLLIKLSKFYNTSIDYIVGDTNSIKKHN